MTQRNLNLRESVAEILDVPLRDQYPNARRGRTQGDLVRAVVSAEMHSSPLHVSGLVKSNDQTDIARAWRFIIPYEGEPTGIQAVEFGVSMKDINGAPNVVTMLDNEVMFDQHVDASTDDAVANLFKYVGGDIAREVYDKDLPFFAAMERRYRAFDEGEGIRHFDWIQLAYPPELMATVDAVHRGNNTRLSHGIKPRKWMERAAKKGGVNRIKSANAMAMSAFASVKHHNETVHVDGA